MAADRALRVLRAADPAALLEPMPANDRLALCARAMTGATPHARPRASTSSRRTLRLALVFAAAALVAAGIAWAAGVLSPTALFQANPQGDGSAPGSLWDQHVVSRSVKRVAAVDIPKVGPVAFWYGRTAERGWCAGLRLPTGEWLGTGKSALDAGGTVPGCFPTREMVNGASTPPVYVIDGFDYQESDVDARSAGGAFWRVRYGRITAPGTVRVTDLVSGTSAAVTDGDLFLLALPDPNPMKITRVHLVAYDAAGKIVSDDCPKCGHR
jgi:hypothetical protein